MRTPLLIVVIAGLAPLAAHADPVHSLRDIAVRALQHDPRAATAAADLDSSFAGKEVALAGYRPDVELVASAGEARYEATHMFHPDRDPSAVGLRVQQPIHDFGRTSSAVAAASALIDAARAGSDAAAIDVIRDAVTAALQLDYAHHVLDTVTQNARVLAERLAYTRARFESGDFTKTDVAQAEAHYAGAQSQMQSARAQLTQAQAALQELIGDAVDVELRDVPNPQTPASLAAALAASAQHPQMQAATAALSSAERNVDIAHAQLHPRVDLVGEVGRDDDTRVSVEATDYWTASLQVSVPLYDRGVARASIRRAEAAVRRQRARVEAVQRTLEQHVRSEWAAFEASHSQLSAAREQSAAAGVALEGMQAELDSGVRTVVDVLDAQQDVLDANLAVLDARYREASSAIRLLASTGTLQLHTLAAEGAP
jgi:outer membrane protein